MLRRQHSFPAMLVLTVGALLGTPRSAGAQHYDWHHHHHHSYYDDFLHHHYHDHLWDLLYYSRTRALYPSLASYRSYYQAVPPLETMVGGNRCRVELRLPVADAEVFVDGAKTTSLGLNRVFESPELKPDATYSYRIAAFWKRGDELVKDERNVQVKAGRTSLVDFTRPAEPERLLAPKELKK